MPVIPFGEYRPDVSDYQAATEQGILNVVPRGDGFGPFPSLVSISASLGAQCRGAFEASKTDGSVVLFAATIDRLYTLSNSNFTWAPVSLPAAVASISHASPAVITYTNSFAANDPVQLSTTGTLPLPFVAGTTYYVAASGLSGSSFSLSATSGGAAINTTTAGSGTHSITSIYTALSAGENWKFRQFNNLVIAVQGNVVPQVFDVSSSTAFANLAGSPPQARYIEVVGRFVVLSGLLSTPNAVQWSGLNDVNSSTSWTAGINSSDIQTFPDGGFVRGVTGVGQSGGFIFQDSIIRQMTYLPGDPRVFDLSVKIAEGLGLYGPGSLVKSGSTVVFYSLKGFQKIDGNGLAPIGRERVDRTFLADLDVSSLGLFQGVADPRSSRALWVYRSVNATGPNQFDKGLLYDVVLDKFTPLKFSGEFLFQMAQPGVTLEALDALLGTNVDLITQSFDNLPAASVAELAAFDASHMLNFFRGPNLEATLQTAEQGTDGTRIKEKTGVRPITDSPVVMTSASRRENLQQTAAFGSESGLNAVGINNMLLDTRYSRFKCRIPAGTSWNFINGIEPVNFKASGKR